jgi:hypothetical protein
MEAPFLVFILLPLFLGGAILAGIYLLTRLMPGVPAQGKAAAVVQPAPARGPEYVQLRARRSAAYRVGLLVLLALAALTVVEFILAAAGSTVLMFIIIVLKAALILYFFMHIASIWRTEEAH